MTNTAATIAFRAPMLGHRDRPRPARRAMPLVLAAAAAAAWGLLSYLPELTVRPWLAGAAVLVAAGFAVAAVVIAREPGHRRAGVVLAVAAVLWPLNSLGGWNSGAMPLVRQFCECVFWVLLPLAVLLYQHPHFDRWARLFAGWIALEFIGGQILWTATSRPEWSGVPVDAWWPSVAPDLELFDGVRAVLGILYAPAMCAFAALLLARGRRAAPVDRYSMAPVVLAIAVAGVAAVVSWSIDERTTVGVALLLLLLPAAFIHAATRLSRLRVLLGEALDTTRDPVGAAPRAAVTSALRLVLRDPELSVEFWSAELGTCIDEAGCVRTPRSHEDRAEIAVGRRDGRLCAVVRTRVTSPAARREVEAAVRLAGTVIENAGLQVVVQAQAEAVGRAHARTLQAGMDERRRLEQDLHDGAQQRLLGVLTLLALARQDRDGGADAVARAEKEIRVALAELRDIAHGLHPTTLVRDGLQDAVAEVAQRLALPVDLQVPTERLDPPVESTIYFVVAEALVNVHKHAGAERAWVRVVPGVGGVDVDIRDDGVGGADPAGSGLCGLRDRVLALGGRFSVRSAQGAGTRLRAWVPCG